MDLASLAPDPVFLAEKPEVCARETENAAEPLSDYIFIT